MINTLVLSPGSTIMDCWLKKLGNRSLVRGSIVGAPPCGRLRVEGRGQGEYIFQISIYAIEGNRLDESDFPFMIMSIVKPSLRHCTKIVSRPVDCALLGIGLLDFALKTREWENVACSFIGK